MLVEYNENGRIGHIVMDPVPEGVAETLTEKGIRFLNLPVLALPDIPAVHPISGEPILDEETGEQIWAPEGYTQAQVDPVNDYVFDEAITPRPSFDAPDLVEIIANGVDEKVVENLPENASLIIDGEPHALEGTTLTLSSDMPAEYTILVQKFPYFERTIKVIAHAA